MTDLYVTMSAKCSTMDAADDAVFGLAFRSSASAGAASPVAANFVKSFIQGTIGATGRRIEEYIASSVIGWDVKVYDITDHLDGSDHGSPIHQELSVARVVAASNPNNSLPSEVAMCVTLKAVGRNLAAVERPDGPDAGTEVDRPMERRTGRIYLGPLNLDAAQTAVGGVCRVREQFRGDVLTKLAERTAFFRDTGIGGVATSLAVWSRKDETTRDVEAVTADNEWDTIRGRGTRASIKSGLLISGGFE